MKQVEMAAIYKKSTIVDYNPYRKEIQEFMGSNFDAAEVYMDASVKPLSNANRYNTCIRKMGLRDAVMVIYRKDKVYLVRR